MFQFQQVEGGVLVNRTCILDGQDYQYVVKGATEAQVLAWSSGMHIQDAMPNVSAEDREFIISGITPDHWNAVFGGDEEE